MTQKAQKVGQSGQTAFLLTLVILATTLRMPITGVGTLLPTIRAELGVSETTMGLLTSVPLLVFAVISPLAAAAERKLGMGRTILASLGLILIGELVRSYTNAAGLFLGTAILACGIGGINVLSLALIKLRSAPERVGITTSVYSTTVSITSTIAVSVSVPIALLLGWRHALAVWAVLALLAIVIWGGQHRRPENQMPAASNQQRTSLKRLLCSPLAWQVTVFVGAQALIYYCVSGWFPTILQSRGFSDVEAGMACSMLQIITMPFTFLVPFLCSKIRPSHIMAGTNTMIAGGLLLFILAPNHAVNYAALAIMGVGLGAVFSMSNMCYSLRTKNAADTAALSGMANCIGYLIGAVGPTMMGHLYDFTTSWVPSLLFLAAIVVVNIISSQLATRERYLFDG